MNSLKHTINNLLLNKKSTIKESLQPEQKSHKTSVVKYKVGDTPLYEGKTVTVQTVGNIPGLVLIKQPNRKPIFVREESLSTQEINEGFVGLASIKPTYIAPSSSGFPKLESLSLSDIGFDMVNLVEDDDNGKKDEQEEDFDNGSNVRHDGHTGKTEVDNLPTPSDTIAPAYSSEKSPKQTSKPLSTHPGYTIAKDPDFDGYDLPADAPEIPTAEFEDYGNAREPNYKGDKSQSNDDKMSESEDKWAQNTDVDKPGHKGGLHKALHVPQGKKIPRSKIDKATHSSNSHLRHMAQFAHNINEEFMFEMDDLLGSGEDTEPKPNAEIHLTMAAMACVLCTVAHKTPDETMLKSIVEALAEVGNEKTIDTDDLDAVASHINSEEHQEMENRENGDPDHQNIDNDGEQNSHSDSWPGDGKKSRTGKTKIMDDESNRAPKNQWYNESDILDNSVISEEDELRMLKRRSGLKFW